MAWSLIKKLIKGHPYWYARVCRRVDGKPRIVQTRYLGTADSIVAAREGLRHDAAPKEVSLAEFGGSTALWDVAQRLDVIATVDRHVPKREQGLSVGQYVALNSINRGVKPCSKAAFAEWYAESALARFIPALPAQLTPQRFWDHLSRIEEEQIRAIESDLCQQAITRFNLDSSLLLFDPTNLFTFIDTFNQAPSLAQRGHCKEGRDSLRILGLAMIATADGPVPLLHDLYPGNRNDVTEFPVMIERLVGRLGDLRDHLQELTIVFDKGNNSQENFDELAKTPFHFVGSLQPGHYQELLQIPAAQFEPMDHPRLQGVRSFRATVHVFGHWRTVVVTNNPHLFESQRKTLEREVRKRLRKLRAVQKRLAVWRAGHGKGTPPTVPSIQKQVDGILHGRHMKELIEVNVSNGRQVPELEYAWNQTAWRRLCNTLLGKTLIFTDNDAWTDEEIVLAYRGQYLLEELHKRIKNPHVLSFRPTLHWTDRMLRVHALCCFIALLLASLLRRDLARQGLDLSLTRLLQELRDIREVAFLAPSSRGKARRPVVRLARMSALQEDLYARLRLARYAGSSA